MLGTQSRNSGKKTTVRPILTLIGNDTAARAIIGMTCRAMADLGQHDLVERYTAEATSGSYHNLLAVTMQYVEVE